MISLILGFLSALVPQGLKLWQDKKDKDHELKVMELQMQAQAQLHTEKLEEINAEADIKSDEATYSAYMPISQYPNTGIKWIDGVGALAIIGLNALNSSVRPLIAYYFAGLYGILKLESDKVIWTETDTDILFLILGHFFGNRAMHYVFGKDKK